MVLTIMMIVKWWIRGDQRTNDNYDNNNEEKSDSNYYQVHTLNKALICIFAEEFLVTHYILLGKGEKGQLLSGTI